MAKTIYTILYDDVLDGSKIITMDNCVCQLFDIRRDYDSLIHDAKEDLSKLAWYVLSNRRNYKKNLTPGYELLQGLRGIPMKLEWCLSR